jgi:undecaprenyl-diphosphatase
MRELVIVVAKYFIALPLLGVGWEFSRQSNDWRLRLGLELVIAAILATVLSRVAAYLYYDPRPFVVQHISPLFPHDPDNGFPSDHTTLAMMVGLVVMAYNSALGRGLVVIAVLIGAARILALVHSPADIVASIGIAIVAVLAARWLTQKYIRPKGN